MSQTQINLSIAHYDSGAAFAAPLRRDTLETTFTNTTLSVSTTPESPVLGDITDPRSVAIKCYGGDDLLVSVDGGTNYPFRLSPIGEALLLRLDFESALEVSTIVCEADTADSLDGDYIVLEDQNGLVWAWFNTGAGAGAPTPTTERLIQVDISTNDTAADVAIALAAALDADSQFSAPVPTTATVVATDTVSGARATGASNGTTGWASVSSTGGSTYFDLEFKSVGTSQVSVAVIPN